MNRFKAAILLYLSSLEHKNFMKLKKTRLFYLVIKLLKPFSVPRACTRRETKRGIGIIFFSYGKLHLCYQLEKKMIPIPLLVFHLVQAAGTVKGFFT